jgi:hypothetical protein
VLGEDEPLLEDRVQQEEKMLAEELQLPEEKSQAEEKRPPDAEAAQVNPPAGKLLPAAEPMVKPPSIETHRQVSVPQRNEITG